MRCKSAGLRKIDEKNLFLHKWSKKDVGSFKYVQYR